MKKILCIVLFCIMLTGCAKTPVMTVTWMGRLSAGAGSRLQETSASAAKAAEIRSCFLIT